MLGACVRHAMTTTARTPARLVIVDDDEAITRTFAKMLTLEGYQVRTAGTAEQGLLEAESFQPDGIILDLRMPLINGLGFLYRLRAQGRHRHTPVVIVTGDYCLDDSVLNELRELGADLRFKPLWLEDLVVIARTMVSFHPDEQPPALVH